MYVSAGVEGVLLGFLAHEAAFVHVDDARQLLALRNRYTALDVNIDGQPLLDRE
jgi:hypothetical protein